jgi:hypothetical protein
MQPKEFYDGWERACGLVVRHGWTKAHQMLMEQYPNNWKPSNMGAYYHAKGAFAYLQEVM